MPSRADDGSVDSLGDGADALSRMHVVHRRSGRAAAQEDRSYAKVEEDENDTSSADDSSSEGASCSDSNGPIGDRNGR